MKLEVGKKYCLRNGTVVTIAGINPAKDVPFPVRIIYPDGNSGSRTTEGKVSTASVQPWAGDIVAPFNSEDDHGCTDAEVRAAVAEETLRCIKQIVGEVKDLSDSVTRDRLFSIHDILA